MVVIQRLPGGRDVCMVKFDELVQEFMLREKVALHAPRWRFGNHPDYAQANIPLAVEGSPRLLRGRAVLTAHRLRKPPKYGFAILFRGERVFALDVNPGHWHTNLLNRQRVGGTHWQAWPDMEAMPDQRDQAYNLWLHEFFRRANVVSRFPVRSPPQGVQLHLWRKK